MAIDRITNLARDLNAYIRPKSSSSGSSGSSSGSGGGSALTSHPLVSPLHTASGLSVGQVVVATGTTTFAWGQLLHTQLGSVTPDQHHPQVHLITGDDHTAIGSTNQLVGLTGTNTLGLITPAATVNQGTIPVGGTSGAITWNGRQTLAGGADLSGAQSMVGPSLAGYTSGWAGAGFHLGYNTSYANESFLELDRLSVRGTMRIYELLVQQIRATNGSLFVTNTGKVKTVTHNGGASYTLETDGDHGFDVADLIRAQRFTVVGGGAAAYQCDMTVTAVGSLTEFTADLRDYTADDKIARGLGNATAPSPYDYPKPGMEFVRLGNTSDTDRQGSLYLSADDTNAPFLQILAGVDSFAAWGTSAKTRARMGRLTGSYGVEDLAFGLGLGDYAGENYLRYADAGALAGLELHFGSGSHKIDSTGLTVDDAGAGTTNLFKWNDTSARNIFVDYADYYDGAGDHTVSRILDLGDQDYYTGAYDWGSGIKLRVRHGAPKTGDIQSFLNVLRAGIVAGAVDFSFMIQEAGGGGAFTSYLQIGEADGVEVLSDLNVSGDAALAGNLNVTGTLTASYIAGSVVTAETESTTWTVNSTGIDTNVEVILSRTGGGPATLKWNGTTVSIDKAFSVSGDLAVSGSVDGVDISAHAANSAAHHAVFTTTEHSAVGNSSPHHAPVTIGASGLSAKLGLSGQELTLAAISHSDLSAIGANDHHNAVTAADTSINVSVQAIGVALATNSGLAVSSGLKLGSVSAVSAATSNTIASGDHTHAVTASANPGAAASLLKTDSDGALQIVGLAVSGNVASHLIPSVVDTYDLGSASLLWRKGYLSELDTLLFAKETITLLGGWLIVANSGTWPVDLPATTDDVNVDFGQSMTVNSWLLSRGNGNTEYFLVKALVGGTTYTVQRNIDTAGANAWAKGTPFVILVNGGGRIELDAYDSPRISVLLQGAAYNTQTEYIRLGDLNGGWGYSGEAFGLALGNYATGKANLVWDATNGLRLRSHSTDILTIKNSDGAAYISGVLQLDTNGGIYQGTGAFGSPTTGLKIWRDAVTGVGQIAGYNGGTIQTYFGTDGKLYAGGGKVSLDATGIHIAEGAFINPTIQFGSAPDPGMIYYKDKRLHLVGGAYGGGVAARQVFVDEYYFQYAKGSADIGESLFAVRASDGAVWARSVSIDNDGTFPATAGQLRTAGDIYCGTAAEWVSAIAGRATDAHTHAEAALGYLNQAVKTTSSPSFTKITAGNGTYGVTCIRGEGSITAQDIGVDSEHQFWSGTYPGVERSLYFYAPEHMGINFCDTITVRSGIVTAYHEVDGTP